MKKGSYTAFLRKICHSRSSLQSYFRVFGFSLSCYCRAKGRYRKKTVLLSKAPTCQSANSTLFFYSATLFSQFLTKQKWLERTCLIFDYYYKLYYIHLLSSIHAVSAPTGSEAILGLKLETSRVIARCLVYFSLVKLYHFLYDLYQL